MRFFIAALAIGTVVVAVGATTCHSNDEQKTEEEVVAEITECSNYRKDGTIAPGEVVICMAEVLDEPLPTFKWLIARLPLRWLKFFASRDQTRLERAKFVTRWSARFGDTEAFSGSVFDYFDTNNDGVWTMMEIVDDISSLILTQGDTNGDGRMSTTEYSSFFLKNIYIDC